MLVNRGATPGTVVPMAPLWCESRLRVNQITLARNTNTHLYVFFSLMGCFPRRSLNFINLPLWTVMHIILSLVFQNHSEQP